MRAIWKGFIRFSLVNIPIKLYSAIESSATVSFKQLHKEDHGQVGYKKVCKSCDTPLAADEIVKGYEYEPGHYVVIEKSDFEKIKLKSTKVIDIEAFVDASEIHPTLFESPYFIGPDGEVASKSYHLLCETLKDTNKLGVGRVVLRDREHSVVISPHEGGMLIYKLRYPDELRKMDSVPQLQAHETEASQIDLAKTLVQTMTRPFTDLELKDRYKAALVEMIHAKIEGKEVVAAAEETAPVVDIMTALKESIEQAKSKKKPMKKAASPSSQDEQQKAS